ncbi:MAG: putative virulence factor [Alphaproteobacteria bacterium]|nr:putative virulence factor [Alphaproteobacteria bacterium]
MIADPTLKASCVQTSGQVGQLSEWLARHKDLAGCANPAIRQAVMTSAIDLKSLVEAAERAPALGLVGGCDTETSEFVTALLRPGGQAGRIVLGQRRAGLGAISSILPGEEDGGAAATVRFRDAASQPDSGAAEFYPVAVSLLGQMDLAAIFCRLYFTHLPVSLRRGIEAHEVRQAIDAAQLNLKVNAVPGLSARDTQELRQELENRLPGVAALRELEAVGYWDWLCDHVSHAAEPSRRQLLSLLWQNEPQLTKLFNRLSDGLNTLGNSYQVFCPHEAVISSDPTTGWVARHRASIASAATLREMAHETSPANVLRITAGGNSVLEIQRSTLAAIASEILIGVEETRLSRLAPAEIAAFPGVGSLNDTTARLLLHAREGPQGGLPLDIAVDLFVRTKSTYLFERACSRHEITALVVRVDPKSNDDDIHAAAIADWVDVAQGENATARERMEAGLSVIASPASLTVRPTPLDQSPMASSTEDGSLQAFELDSISGGSKWLKEWTPGRGFERTHWIGSKGAGAGENGTPAVLQLTGNRFSDGDLSAVSDRMASNGSAALETVADRVFKEIAPSCTPMVKARQIRHHLRATRKSIRARLIRFHQSNDPARFMDWRQQVANVAATRLEACRTAGRIGRLWDGLSPTEEQLVLLVSSLIGDATLPAGSRAHGTAGSQSGGQARSMGERGGRGDDAGALPSAAKCARAIIQHWLKSMYGAADSRRLCRKVGIAQPVLQHVVDELAFGAIRLNLTSELTQLLSAIDMEKRAAADVPIRYAAVAKRFIGAYLERPAPFIWNGIGEHGAASGGAFYDGDEGEEAGGLGAGDRDEGPTGARNLPSLTDGTDTQTHSPAIDWPGAFRALVERNISAAGAVAARSEVDRELGKQLSVFTTSPFEVDL